MINYNEYTTQLNKKYKSGFYTGMAAGIVITTMFYSLMFIAVLFLK